MGTTDPIEFEQDKMPSDYIIFTYVPRKEEFKKYEKSEKSIVLPAYTGFWFVKKKD